MTTKKPGDSTEDLGEVEIIIKVKHGDREYVCEIEMEDGMYIASIREIGQVTWSRDMCDLLSDISRTIDDYFAAKALLGI